VDCPPIPEDLGSCATRAGVVSTVAVSLNPPRRDSSTITSSRSCPSSSSPQIRATPGGVVRRLAFDRTLPPSEALGRIRDAYRDYGEVGACTGY
jgi:hypothetical protein